MPSDILKKAHSHAYCDGIIKTNLIKYICKEIISEMTKTNSTNLNRNFYSDNTE